MVIVSYISVLPVNACIIERQVEARTSDIDGVPFDPRGARGRNSARMMA